MKSTSRNEIRQKGFTLIELLVVIAIIAILASILFPVFARARENARRASCQSNLKQIGLGILQYTQDYDEKMPFPSYGWVSGSDTAAGNNPSDWMDVLQPYLKSYQVLQCPSDASTDLPPALDNQATSYVVNVHGQTESLAAGPPFSHTNAGSPVVVGSSSIESPATQLMVADNSSTSGSPSNYQTQSDWSDLTGGSGIGAISTTTPRTLQEMSERHLETINTLFCDGHVKAVKLTYFLAPSPDNSATHLTNGADPE
jgi:prepilin-type N-terminal cleavage/methylation domain-containing protein/prepilin-type processing-associated H-X9-DG protein